MEKDNTGFCKRKYDPEYGLMLNNHPIKILRGTEVEINGNKYNKTSGLPKVITNKTYETAKSMNDMEEIVFRVILQKTENYKCIPTKGRMSGRVRFFK